MRNKYSVRICLASALIWLKAFLLCLGLAWFSGAALAAASVAKAAVVPPPVTPLVQVADGRLLAPSIARIVNRGELVVAMHGVDQPPFFYVKDNELVGLDVNLAKSIAKELNVKIRFDRRAQSFNEVIDVVARQEADLAISKMSRTLARAQMISFTEPYLRLNHAFVLNRIKFAELARNRPLPVVVREFTGSIGVIANSSFSDYARKNFPRSEIREFPRWNDVIASLHKGEILAAYRDEFEAKRILKNDPTASLTLRTVTFKDLEDTLSIAVGIQSPTLLAFVNQFLSGSTNILTIDQVLQAPDR